MNAKEFKSIITNHLITTNPEIKENDLYFEQCRDKYYITYKPKYPDVTPGDFCVSGDIWNGKVSMFSLCGDIHIMKRYKDINNFINGIEED